MFYKNILKSKKTKNSDFTYDILSNCQKTGEDDSILSYNEPKIVYNFITEDGTLKAGYGFKDLAMPQSKEDLDTEYTISIRGTKVLALWKLKWFDSVVTNKEKYYLFYFNDENLICYDNVLDMRYITVIVENTYTEVPYATYYRRDKGDSLLLSGEGNNLMLITGSGIFTSETAPIIISCCTHYGKLFAISEESRGTLIYNEDVDVMNWTDEKTKDLDFSDGRGNLNKIMSFNDYVYVFRDFGITKISIYGSDEEFSISHMYFSDSYIYPNSIAQSGDNIYFLTTSGLKVFNGSSVKDISVECIDILNKCDNKKCYGTCFEGKYYLACRGDFNDDCQIGCESYSEGYVNNTLFVYDILSGHIEILRGIDINQVLALTNPYKSKLVACFNNEHIGKIGELTNDGKIFGESVQGSITFAKTDFGKPNIKKRIKSILINSEKDCEVSISNEEKTYKFSIKANENLQKIRTNIVGKTFTVKIDSSEEDAKISKFILTIGQEE